jgi:hypothetical protein
MAAQFTPDQLNPSVDGPIQAEFVPASSQARQNSAFCLRMDCLRRKIARCMASTSERIQHTREMLSTTTELVAYSHEAIARSVHLLKARDDEDRSDLIARSVLRETGAWSWRLPDLDGK